MIDVIFRFMEQSPYLFFLALIIICSISVSAVVRLACFMINRPLRHWNIHKHGYPPSHCDADGDFKGVD